MKKNRRIILKNNSKKKEKVLTNILVKKNPKYTLNGKKDMNIRGKTRLIKYDRQRIKDKKTNKIVIPINNFFKDKKNGIGYISKNLEKEIIEKILSSSYRNTEKNIRNQLSKESIRTIVKEKGKKAEELEKINKKIIILDEKNTKDASSQNDNYKKSKGSFIRNLFSNIFGLEKYYVMVDGVGIQGQGKDWEGIKECKLACVLKQEKDKIKEVGILSTWERINGFRNKLEWLMLGIIGISIPIVIISDGAKWIRNLRNRIHCLKNAIWILDWFHVKEKVKNTLRTLEIEEVSKVSQDIIGFLWIGEIETVIKLLKRLSLSDDKEKKEQQKISIANTIKYLENQREGIVNYQAYQMKGYIIGSGYVEKKNDTLIKDRMVRQKRMRWGKEGGEAIIQLLTAQMNGRLEELF